MKFLKGWIGEKKTAFFLWLYLSGKAYHSFHNVILRSGNGTTQIDHIVVSVFGVFIIETKNIKGWIFGSESQANWTQSIYGNNYSFQNPLRQTYRQKKVLAEFLDIEESSIYPIVYFVGKVRFRTPMPKNVLSSRLIRFIKRFRDPIFTLDEVDHMVSKIEWYRSTSSIKKREHIKSLKKRIASDTNCPKCGSRLVERTARKGKNRGTRFLGCTGYPRCRFTKDL